MGSREFVEWQAYYEYDPFGLERGDIQAAQIVAALVNTWRDTKKSPNPFPITDFIMRFGKETPEEQEVKLQAKIAAWAEAQGAGRPE